MGENKKSDENEIITSTKNVLSRGTPKFCVGFRHALDYLHMHTQSVFKKNKDAEKRKEIVAYLKDTVYTKEQKLFEGFGVKDDYIGGYLSGFWLTLQLWETHPNFGVNGLFNKYYGLLKEKDIWDWIEETRKKELADEQQSANNNILRQMKEKVHGREKDFVGGYRRGMQYFEIHARIFFEARYGAEERREKIALLQGAYAVEEKIFEKLGVRDSRKGGYLLALKEVPSLLEENISFNATSLFNRLDVLLKKEMGIYKKGKQDGGLVFCFMLWVASLLCMNVAI